MRLRWVLSEQLLGAVDGGQHNLSRQYYANYVLDKTLRPFRILLDEAPF